MDNWWRGSPEKYPKLIQSAFIIDNLRSQVEELLQAFILPINFKIDFYFTAKSHKRKKDSNEMR